MSPLWLPHDNRLLAQLCEADLALLGPVRRVELASQNTIEVANQPIESVYFMERGFASVVSESGRDGMIEVGLIGREGMTGLPIVHGASDTPFNTFLQSDGAAIRVDAETLRNALMQSETLRALLMLYAQAFAVQLASNASANGTLLLEQRLARWLLMVADRMGEGFRVTHESLAIMLAVRRPGVTTALNHLEGRGLIRMMRGAVAIADRKGLVDYTDGAYGVAEQQYERLIGDFESSGRGNPTNASNLPHPSEGGR